MIAAVPLADDPGGVPRVLEEPGDGDLVGVQTLSLTGEEDRGVVDASTTKPDP